MTQESATVLASLDNSGTDTVYTVPSTGEFYLTNVNLTLITATEGGQRNNRVLVTVDGIQTSICSIPTDNNTPNGGNPLMVFNLQNPLKLDQGSNIEYDSNGSGRASVAILGYTRD